ncbi:bifunctional adenosylcobinamide kinase/adenosylcobinamide-phosphate guanylyltransferase [Rhizobium sp. C4]|uniref:bifunctional adenosylcobinamide kinase/adenosylcobinamide-phosphate guanylyltransferase n=1 Tax=Rhizobium sp. C4 TaxID=1349800 RepID=UPI001E54D019|nr:bifunctional adenosylcobinamide kinase/adenosylcobinamide-phosphate guanylyltransferase [Rhizobium sp. C4]MCD2173298.1 bifunctional adenosylcobinamide kinase/adenosylcobinamide-phosphate guanylyltransferase [Rhizobium sp. C4]
MTRNTFILGGARSGKSALAEQLARESGGVLHYIATGQAWDAEMRTRIDHHQSRRGQEWTTIEAPLELTCALTPLDYDENTILIDCLTLWVTNLMMAERDMDEAFDRLVSALAGAKAQVFIVSNEVGLGIVPDNAMARAFRDHAGRLHQKVAAVADEVYFVAAGLPLKMKG